MGASGIYLLKKTYAFDTKLTADNATKKNIIDNCIGYAESDVDYLGSRKKIPKQINFNTEETDTYKLSYFRKIANRYKFIKNTFGSNPLLKYLYSEEILKRNTAAVPANKNLGTSAKPVIVGTAKLIYDEFAKYSMIDNDVKTLDKFISLSDLIRTTIESSNPATLIGTVDFQEYTQFRDTSKLYMTCDGKNNSWQIDPLINKEFETQPLPQQGGNYEWIDINI